MPSYYLIPKKIINRLPALQRVAWWLEALLFRSMFASMRLMSPERCSAFLAKFFALIGPHTPKAAKVRKNLAIVMPDADEHDRNQVVRQVFANLGRATAELVHLENFWRDRERFLEFIADEAAETELRAGKPMVFVTAHVGAWQLTNLVGENYGCAISTVYARESNPYLAELFYRLRRGFKTRLVPSEGGVRELLKELQQGHSVGLAVDTRLDSGEMIPFFDIPAPTNTVAARLALRTKCKLMPARAERLDNNRFRITVLPPVEPPDPALSQRDQAIAMTADLNRMFESWILEDPSQWMCLKRRWPKNAVPKGAGQQA